MSNPAVIGKDLLPKFSTYIIVVRGGVPLACVNVLLPFGLEAQLLARLGGGTAQFYSRAQKPKKKTGLNHP